jgi:hypothetical protein
MTSDPEPATTHLRNKKTRLLALAALVLTGLILYFVAADSPHRHQPAPGPVDASPPNPAATTDPSEASAIVHRGAVIAADFPTLELPVQVANFSFDWVKKSIRTQQKLPPKSAVRLEEILNHYPLQFAGAAAIAGSSAKNVEPGHLASLTTETLPCPWKPSATLLLISLSGNPHADCEIKIAFHANTENVFRYRLLGFAAVSGAQTHPLPTKVAADTTTLLAVEIESKRLGTSLGHLEWTTNGIAAPAIPLSHHLDSEPSDDARFATLVCSFSQWLSGDQTGVLDAEIVSALAREIASSTLPLDRADFLKLVEEATRL